MADILYTCISRAENSGRAQIFDCVATVRLWDAHSPPRGSGGHASPENFGNFDSLRAFLMHSGSSSWTDLVAVFTRALYYKHLEL